MYSEYMDRSGEQLFRKPACFYWRGRYFPGLVSSDNALYDDPKDSFADYVGMESSESKGLIFEI